VRPTLDPGRRQLRQPAEPFRSGGGGLAIEGDVAAPSGVDVVRHYIEVAAEGGRTPGSEGPLGLSAELASALDRVVAGTADDDAVAVIERAVEHAADTAMAPGGAGLMQVARVPGVLAALDAAVGRKRERRNPFGKHAGLRTSKKTYDRQRAYRFKKNYGRWLPYLVVWDAALRLIASEARIRRRFKPGFVLDDNLVGLTAQPGPATRWSTSTPTSSRRWSARTGSGRSPSRRSCTGSRHTNSPISIRHLDAPRRHE
jgi:hypothetical protein